MATLETNLVQPSTGTTLTLGAASDVIQIPASAEIDIASGATLDVNGTLDVTGATVTGLSASYGLFSSYAIIADQKVGQSGTFTSGAWRTRDLNTEIADPDGIVSIASDQFTLAAGSYLIKWIAPAFYVNLHQTRLYNVTDAAQVEVGVCAFVNVNSVVTTSSGCARTTIAGSKAFTIEHYCATTAATAGFGQNCAFSVNDQYTLVEIFKEV